MDAGWRGDWKALGGRSLKQLRREVPDMVRLEPRARYLYRIRVDSAGSCSDLAHSDSLERTTERANATACEGQKKPFQRRFFSVSGQARGPVRRNGRFLVCSVSRIKVGG